MSRPVGVEPEDETTSKVSVRYLSDADQAWLNWKLLNQENLPAPAVSRSRIRTIKPEALQHPKVGRLRAILRKRAEVEVAPEAAAVAAEPEP